MQPLYFSPLYGGSGPGVLDEGGAAVAGCLTALDGRGWTTLRFADLCPGSQANLPKQEQVLLL